MTSETTTALTTAQYVREQLARREEVEGRLTALLMGSGIEPEQFVGMTIQAIAREPKLMADDIDRDSLLIAILSVAEMGLAPTGSFGGAWLVPFRAGGKKKVQPIIDWRGFIKMAMRSGQLKSAWAQLRYPDESFRVELGSEPRIVHTRGIERDESKQFTHVYAVAHLLNGDRVFEVMTLLEVEAIRKRSRAAEEGPWVSDHGEMARKTAIRRLFKYLPAVVTPQLAHALEVEDQFEQGAPTAPIADRPRSRYLDYLVAQPTETGTIEPEMDPDDGLPELPEGSAS